MKEPGEIKVKKFEREEFKPERKRGEPGGIIEIPKKTYERKLGDEGKEIREKIRKDWEEKEEIKKLEEKLGIGEKKKEPQKEEPKGLPEDKKREQKKVFETVNEIVGIPAEELIEYDDLILDDSKEGWQARKDEEKYRKEVIATAAGIKSEEARKYLTERLGKGEKQKNWKVICGGLAFNDTEWADGIRGDIRYDKDVGRVRAERNAKIAKFLGLNKSEEWYNFRKVIDKAFPSGFYLPGDLLLSETGVPAENKTKQDLLAEFGELHPAEAILSFSGDSSLEAQKNVEKYYGKDKKLEWAYKRYQKSIEGLAFEKNEKS